MSSAGVRPLRLVFVLGGLAAAGVIASGVLGGCAHVAPPGGGPVDSVPPVLIAVQPDSLSVNPGFRDRVRFLFDESVSEQGVDRAVMLFPWEGLPDVNKGGDDIKVRPRDGWVDDRIYHIVIAPMIQDLFNNRIRQPIHYVFSTGIPIPADRVSGIVDDRMTARPLAGGRVDFVHMPDSLRYGAGADSVGAFDADALPPGDYVAIGYEDRDQNYRADPYERADTQQIRLEATDTLELMFQVFEHDTVPPTLARADAVDSMTVALEFDLFLDPEARLSKGQVEIVNRAGEEVPLDTLLQDWEYRPWLQAQRSGEGGRAGASGTPDTSSAAQDTAAAGARVGLPGGPSAQPAQGPLPVPARRILAVALQPILPDTYTVRARDIRGLSGLVGGGEVQYEQPPPPPPPERPKPPPEGTPPDTSGVRKRPGR